jgi:GNAT superfamily N-acetyltransferase/uncharacterized glyoxalase superfamily protein PhnB
MNVEPILAVPDVPAATRYYKDTLDFQDVWHWGDPPVHGGANRDGVQLQFSYDPELAEHAKGLSFWLRVRNVAALFSVHQERQAEILSPLEPKPWGVTEYTVRDLNGYRLRFAGVSGAPGESVSLPPDVRIELRLPTSPEMRRLIDSVGWADPRDPDTVPRVLQAALIGVVAVVAGATVGCAFLTTDACGFYYVRDVIVHPDWQRKRIGTALMHALMAHARERVPPGALIGLFTGENLHEFYAQFGFRGPNSGLYGMTMEIN